MKKIFLFVLTLLFVGVVCAQSGLEFDLRTHDFGSINRKDGDVSFTFMAVNKGASPVVILDAKVLCGCTTVKYPKQPIMPNDSVAVVVNFEPKTQPSGDFYKAIQIMNNSEQGRSIVTIRGSIID
ncbi:MAG: DUF1573 domain-containing protein [Rikenellaceae bacterium]